MKNWLKCLIVVGVLMMLAGLLYAFPTLVHEDGNAPVSQMQASARAPVNPSAPGANRSVVAASGNSSPSISNGSAATPFTDPIIAASYIRSDGGDPPIVFLANGGPMADSLAGELTEQVIAGGFADAGGAAGGGDDPRRARNTNPLRSTSRRRKHPPRGSGLTGGPIHLGSPQTPESPPIVLSSSPSSSGSPNQTSVPDGGMTLLLLGSAMSGLALLKKML